MLKIPSTEYLAFIDLFINFSVCSLLLSGGLVQVKERNTVKNKIPNAFVIQYLMLNFVKQKYAIN